MKMVKTLVGLGQAWAAIGTYFGAFLGFYVVLPTWALYKIIMMVTQ